LVLKLGILRIALNGHVLADLDVPIWQAGDAERHRVFSSESSFLSAPTFLPRSIKKARFSIVRDFCILWVFKRRIGSADTRSARINLDCSSDHRNTRRIKHNRTSTNLKADYRERFDINLLGI